MEILPNHPSVQSSQGLEFTKPWTKDGRHAVITAIFSAVSFVLGYVTSKTSNSQQAKTTAATLGVMGAAAMAVSAFKTYKQYKVFNPPKPKMDADAYYELIHRGFPTEQKRAELNAKLDLIKPEEITAIKAALYSQDWNNTSFADNDHFPYIALAGVKAGDLSTFDFDLIMAYWTSKTYFAPGQVQKVSLFNPDGSVNADALQMISSTLDKPLDPTSDKPLARIPYRDMDDAQLAEFIKKMRTLPASQTQFFVVPQRGEDNLPNVSDRIKNGPQVNVMRHLPHGQMMVPSLGMVQTYLDVKFGDHKNLNLNTRAIEINPVIGPSKAKRHIANNGLDHKRDVMTRFPGAYGPVTADGQLAPGIYFRDHDLYHTYLASGVPVTHAQAMIHLAFRINSGRASLKDPNDRQAAKIVFKKIVDMEHTAYRPDTLKANLFQWDDHQRFWNSMLHFVNRIPSNKETDFKNTYVQAIVRSILLEGTFKKEFGIDPAEGLSKFSVSKVDDDLGET